MSTTYSCIIYFLSQSFLAVTHFVILCSGYRLLKVYHKIVKKQLTFDLYIRMLHNCLAYFSQNPQIRNWCIYWWDLCSLAVHYFLPAFLSAYFCFACQTCVPAQLFGKIKTNASCLYVHKRKTRSWLTFYQLFIAVTPCMACICVHFLKIYLCARQCFCSLLPHAFLYCVHSRYDTTTISSRSLVCLSQNSLCACGVGTCLYMFLCLVYRISKFVAWHYEIFFQLQSGEKSKNDCILQDFVNLYIHGSTWPL